jgi:hypothetical protein
MEKERQEALEWFVQFANMNLNELRPGDKAKLRVESEEYLFPAKEELKSVVKGGPYLPQNMPESLKKRFEISAGETSWGFKEPPQRDSEEYWSTILHLQDVVRRVLYLFSEKALVPGKGFDYAVQTGEKAWVETVIVRSEWNYEKFIFSLIPLGRSHDHYIRIKLNLLLNGLSRSNLQRCLAPKCNKYFINISLRKKRFCSSRCMWRFNSAKRRDANREDYREYQRVLMRDRYREKKGLQRKKTKSRKAKKGE